jgi:hypothetical protein
MVKLVNLLGLYLIIVTATISLRLFLFLFPVSSRLVWSESVWRYV